MQTRPAVIALVVLSLLAASCATLSTATPSPTGASRSAATLGATAEPSSTLTPLAFGMASQNASYWLLYVAQAKGFAQGDGLSLEFVQLGSAPRIVQATVAKSAPISMATPDAIVAAGEKGADVVMIAGNTSKPIYSLLARPGTRSAEDLRGQLLGVSSLSTGEVPFLKAMLAKHGLEAERDYDLFVAGGPPERYIALRNGTIAGAVFSEPQESMLMADGYPRLAQGSEIFSDYQFHAFFSTRSWLADNSDTAVRFIRAMIQSGRWLHDASNAEEATRILSEAINVEPPIARSVYKSYVQELQALPREAELSIPGVQVAAGTLDAPAGDVTPFVDLHYRERALTDLR